jgi:transcriptional regulator with XRE-family HTH domain
MAVVPRRPQNAQLLRAFGDRLRTLRTTAGLSQEKLAELADVHRTYVGHLERATVTPTLDTLVRLADALDVDTADLVRGLRAR